MLPPIRQMPEEYARAAAAAPHGDARLAVIREAWSWMHTPWRHEQRMKRNELGGGGVDCGNFLAGVFANAGLIEEPPLYHYPHDFYKHSDKELFREIVSAFCDEVRSGPVLPADIIGLALGKVSVGHTAIVIGWPICIHASGPKGKVELIEGNLGKMNSARSSIWRLREWN